MPLHVGWFEMYALLAFIGSQASSRCADTIMARPALRGVGATGGHRVLRSALQAEEQGSAHGFGVRSHPRTSSDRGVAAACRALRVRRARRCCGVAQVLPHIFACDFELGRQAVSLLAGAARRWREVRRLGGWQALGSGCGGDSPPKPDC